MVRTVLGAVAGVIAWIVLVTVIDRTMRHFWPDYAAVFKAMTFTLPMMIARLAESTVALVVATIAVVRIAPASRAAYWAFGILMLLCFIPIHYMIWTKFPVWYHAYFLASLVALPVIVARAMRGKAG